jgi:hypothetical protein
LKVIKLSGYQVIYEFVEADGMFGRGVELRGRGFGVAGVSRAYDAGDFGGDQCSSALERDE